MPVLNGTHVRPSYGGLQWGCTTDLESSEFFAPNVWRSDRYVNGVAKTSNLPVSMVPRSLTSEKLKSHFDDYYNRFHISLSTLDVGNLITTKLQSLEVWSAFPTNKLLSSIALTNAEGITITEPIGNVAPVVYNGLESMVYTLNITTVGPPRIDALVSFNFASYVPTLTIVGDRVVIWPYKPNYPLKESFEWKTDVIQTFNKEQRIALRNAPRQSIQSEAIISANEFSKARAIAFQWAHRVFGVPMWIDMRYIGTINIGATFIDLDTTKSDFRANDLLLIWTSNENYTVVDITTLTTTRITFKTPLVSGWTKACVAPVRFAFALSGIQFTRDADTIIKTSTDFDIRNNKNLNADIGLVKYKNLQVFTDEVMSTEAVSDKIARSIDVFDNGSGIFDVDITTNYVNIITKVSIRGFSRSDVWRYKQFFGSLYGRQKTFFIPSKHDDFIVVEDVISTNAFIKIQNVGYTLYYRNQFIMIKTKAGTLYFAKVISSSDIGGGLELLNIDLALGTTIPFADVLQACVLKHVRLDSDKIDFSHGVGDHMQCTFNVREVPYVV